MKLNLKFLFFYLVISAIELLIDIEISSLVEIRWVTKPLLMILLMLFVHNNIQTKEKYALHLIFLFAWLGDVFLMFSNPIGFPLGLGSFLVMQVLYIRYFLKSIDFKRVNWKVGGLVLCLFIGYIVAFLSVLWQGVGRDLLIPVVLYAIALGSMAFFAILRNKEVSRINFLTVFSGAILFVISDSLLAYNKFVQSIPQNSFWVMGTYILAQLLLSIGLVNFVIRKRLNAP